MVSLSTRPWSEGIQVFLNVLFVLILIFFLILFFSFDIQNDFRDDYTQLSHFSDEKTEAQNG